MFTASQLMHRVATMSRVVGTTLCIVALLFGVIPGGGVNGSTALAQSPAEPPGPPPLLAPALRAADVPTSPTFVWGSAPGAASYQLQVSTWPDFSQMVLDKEGMTDTSFTPPFLFADGTMYFWRVRSVNAAGASLWAPSESGWIFTTETDNLPPPTPVTPPFEAVDVPLVATFAWNSVSGADAYELQISPSIEFSDIVYEQTGIASTSHTLPGPLPPGSLLFWRVRSIGGGGASLWSPTVSGWPFLTVASSIARPVQVSPSANATGVEVMPTLAWDPVPGAEAYVVQISTQEIGTDAEMTFPDITETSFVPPIPLANLTTYFWRVSAVGGGEMSMWSSPLAGRAFTTAGSGVPAPVLVAPADGAVDVPKSAPLIWHSVEGALSYDVHVYAEQFIGGTSFILPGVPDTSVVVPEGKLVGGMQYFWRVRANTSAGNSAWGPVGKGWTFTTGYDIPAAPHLFVPEHGAKNLQRYMILAWWNRSDSVATTFDVQVATDPEFTGLVVARNDVPRTEIVELLPANTKFFWRVRASNPAGKSPWSSIWMFTTKDAVLEPPSLVSPADGADDVPLQPTFTWRPVSGVTAYQLQVSTTESFNLEWLLTINQGNISGTTYKSPVALKKTTLYYWRVRGMNDTDTSLWSPMLANRTFRTAPPIPPAPVLVSPVWGDTTVHVSPTFCWQEAPGAKSYGIEIATDQDFVNVVYSACGIEGTCLDLPSVLSGSTRHYWRVNARNTGGVSDFSRIWDFVTMPSLAEAPVVTQQPVDQIVLVGQPATLVVGAKGTGPLTYQWQKNNVDIPGAISPVYTTPVAEPGDNGAKFRCIVTNAHGVATSEEGNLLLTTVPVSVVKNGTFELGSAPWEFYTNGTGTFDANAPGEASAHAARVVITGEGTNVQLYQYGIALEPYTTYQLTFRARSRTGNDLEVSLSKHGCPYTPYGLFREFVDVEQRWNVHTMVFTTQGFAAPVQDARLTFVLGSFDQAEEEYFVDDVVLVKYVSSNTIASLLVNAGFEAGTRPWSFYTDGVGSMKDDVVGPGSMHAAHITITEPGANVQLYQTGVKLEPKTLYRLTFKAYSTTGHDVIVSLHRHQGPFASYGLSERKFDLGTSWGTHSILFVTPEFPAPVNDGRLRFWLAPYDAAGDEYFFDDIVLEKATTPSGSVVDNSLMANPGFENGTSGWWFHTNGAGAFAADAAGHNSPHAARVTIITEGTNVQLSQTISSLESWTTYQLTFKAFSSSGHDLQVALHQDKPPHDLLGIMDEEFELTDSWKTFTIVFTTPYIDDPANPARLRFWFAPYDAAGDQYYIDDVVLEKLDGTAPASTLGASTADASEQRLPRDFVLETNYPNPFNPSTTIVFGLPEVSEVSLKVYNILGQEVANLIEGMRPAGYASVVWDTRNSNGLQLSSGMYLYRFTAKGLSGKSETIVRPMMFLK